LTLAFYRSTLKLRILAAIPAKMRQPSYPLLCNLFLRTRPEAITLAPELRQWEHEGSALASHMNSSHALNQSSRLKRSLIGVAWLSAILSGCGPSTSKVPVGDAAENIRKLTLAYVEYAAAHKGVGPPDQAALAETLVKTTGDSAEEANHRFTSPRDNKPYVIRWNQRPMGPPRGHDPPKATLLIYEQDGMDGTRYTADGQLSIKEMSDDNIRQTYPEFEDDGS
jgi:hypothetical protein